MQRDVSHTHMYLSLQFIEFLFLALFLLYSVVLIMLPVSRRCVSLLSALWGRETHILSRSLDEWERRTGFQSIDPCLSFLDYQQPSESISSFPPFSYPRIAARSRMREWVLHQTKLIISSIGIYRNQVRRFLLLHLVGLLLRVVVVFVRHYFIASDVSRDLFPRCICPSLSLALFLLSDTWDRDE